MSEISQLCVTHDEYRKIQAAQAVVVNKYRSNYGLYSHLAFIGTKDECDAVVETPAILIVVSGVEYLGSEVVLTKNLLPPDPQ